jgi:hypothetical protein
MIVLQGLSTGEIVTPMRYGDVCLLGVQLTKQCSLNCGTATRPWAYQGKWKHRYKKKARTRESVPGLLSQLSIHGGCLRSGYIRAVHWPAILRSPEFLRPRKSGTSSPRGLRKRCYRAGLHDSESCLGGLNRAVSSATVKNTSD